MLRGGFMIDDKIFGLTADQILELRKFWMQHHVLLPGETCTDHEPLIPTSRNLIAGETTSCKKCGVLMVAKWYAVEWGLKNE